MKSINATLLTNQKLPSGRPYATATLADNNRLHPTLVVTDGYTGGKTIGVECGTFYVRVRYKAGGSNTLEVQKITNPATSSQWTTWSALVASNVNNANSVGLFWTGGFAVVVWQDTPSADLKYKRSSDGVSWSATAIARTGLVAAISAAGASGTSPDCGVMEAYQSQIYWQGYTAATDTWAAAASAGASFLTAAPEIAAFKDTANGRYVAAVAVNGYVNWAQFAIVIFTRATGSNTWSTGQIVFSSLTNSFGGLCFSQRQVNGYWWLSFYKTRLWNVHPVSTYLISASNDGLFYDDPLPTGVAGNELSLCILPAPSGGTWANAYWSTERTVHRLDGYTYWSASVVAYHFLTGRSGHQEGGGINAKGGVSPTVPTTQGTIVALLDNRTGALTAPRLYSVFTLTRGLVIAGVQRGQSAGAWYVTGFRYILESGLLEITATDARGLLGSWFADTAYTYRGNTIKFLVERVCALAGVHSCTFDSNAAWTDVITAYTHPIGENAIYSLRSLAERLPFEYVPQEDGSLAFYVPNTAPASVYTFGAGASEHRAWLSASPKALQPTAKPQTNGAQSWAYETPPWFGASEAVTYLQDIGSPPKTRVGESIDQTQLYALGRRRSLIINDRRLTTDAMATAAVAALLLAGQERQRAGAFATPPSFSLEPGDVVTINDGAYAQSAGTWRVEQFEEHFNQTGAEPYHQLITVRGTA